MSLVERFLRYSLERGRPIKVMLLRDGQPWSGNITVLSLNEDQFTYTTARNKKTPQTMRTDDLLSASYARGDDGDTLANRKDTQ